MWARAPILVMFERSQSRVIGCTYIWYATVFLVCWAFIGSWTESYFRREGRLGVAVSLGGKGILTWQWERERSFYSQWGKFPS